MTHPARTALPLTQLPLLRHAQPWWIGAPLFVLILIGYCELWSIVSRTPTPGLAISGGWALRIAFGWMIAVGALQHFGPRVAGSRMSSSHPWITAITCVAGVAAFTLASEWILSQLSGRWSSGFAFLYARLPLHFAVSALLVALFARLHSSRTPVAPPPVAAFPAASSEPIEALLEVMTGTGHTTIRIADIEWLKAERNYVSVMHRSGRTYLLRRTMTALEATLDPSAFARIHRSCIVNRTAIKERRTGGTLVLHSGVVVRVGRAFRDRV